MKPLECRSCGREIVVILEPYKPPPFGTSNRNNKSTRLSMIHKDDLKDQQVAEGKAKMVYKLRGRLEDKCRGERERAD